MVKKYITAFIAFSILIMSQALSGCGSGGSASSGSADDGGKKVVNIAVQPSSAFIPMYVARANGWIEEALKEQNVEVHWSDFESGPPMIESFAAGQQDFGTLGDMAASSSIASGQKNTFVAVIDGGPAYAIMAKPDSPIKNVADLKGKKIGLVVGSTAQNITEKLLKNAGLSINDVEIINITPGDAQTVLSQGMVDAVSIWEPSVTRLEADGTAKVIADGTDVGFRGVNVLAVRSDYLKQNPEIVKVILEQYYRAVQEMNKNPDKYTPALTEYYSLEPDLIAKTYTKYDNVMEFADADIDALQDTVSFLKSIDAISNEVTVKDYVNDDIAKEIIKK